MVEDLYDLLHDINTRLVERGYPRLEELLDSAGFSGLISRAVCDGLAKHSRELDINKYPGGYPDLLPRGVYVQDRVQHGDRGGLEVKASRFAASWQSHSPRAGWFCVVQFTIDTDRDKPVRGRDPTTVAAIMVAELDEEDWSWAPAGEGKKRTGTASIVPSGRAKLRAGAVWVDPLFEETHQERLADERCATFRQDATDRVLAVLRSTGAGMKAADVAGALAPDVGVPAESLFNKVTQTLRALARDGHAIRVSPGVYVALSVDDHLGLDA